MLELQKSAKKTIKTGKTKKTLKIVIDFFYFARCITRAPFFFQAKVLAALKISRIFTRAFGQFFKP